MMGWVKCVMVSNMFPGNGCSRTGTCVGTKGGGEDFIGGGAC